jgi:hypothetical protein
MTLLIWVVRILVILLILRLIVRYFSAARVPIGPRRSGRAPLERAGGTLVRDPQCGTYIPQATALSIGRGTDLTYFCSVECRDRWAESNGLAAGRRASKVS